MTVSSSGLTFTTTTWCAEQTVTVTAGQDADAAVDMATLTHNPSGADYNSVSHARLTVTIPDDETAGVTVTPTLLTLNEGGTDTYTVVLDTQPTGTVTIGVADDSAEVNVSTSSLTFTTSDWNTAQTVTVASIADDVDEETETATVMHMVNGGDYTGLTAAAVTVTVTDDDTRGVMLSATSLTIEEGDGSTYTVVLTSAPTANVTVEVSSDTPGVTVSPSSLTFTAGNWNSARTVTVSSEKDSIDEEDQTASVTHLVSGGDYGAVVAAGVAVTVTDDDTRGLTLSAPSLTVDEGGRVTYTVRVDSQPTADVTVSIGSDVMDVSVNPAILTFTTSSWATPQTVTATANEDDVDKDAGVTATLTHAASGGDYGSESGSVSVAVTDNDTRGVTVSQSSLTIEEGGSGPYTVALTSAPTGDVTVEVSSDTPGVTVSPSSLTFTAGNWNSARTVTVSSEEDSIDEEDQTASVTHLVSGGDYGAVVAAGVAVTVTDDDTRGLTLSAPSLTVDEGGRGTYTVKLDSQPTAEVTVSISSDIADVTVNPATLTFTTSNWASSQTVTATARQDDIDKDAGVMASLTHMVSGGDYTGLTADGVTVTVNDNDARGVTVSPTSRTVNEGGSSTYTVALTSAPTGDVMITVSSDNTDVTVSPPSLTFTMTNWNSAQTVTVSATNDDIDKAAQTVSVTRSVSGGDYGSVSATGVTVTVNDNDARGVRVTPMSLTVNEGGMNTYTVVLDTQPTDPVTVTIADPTANTDVTANPASLRFTASNWDTEQTVTVSAAEDADSTRDTATVRHTVSGGDYGGVTASSVAVTVTDNETPGVVTPLSLTVGEGAWC